MVDSVNKKRRYFSFSDKISNVFFKTRYTLLITTKLISQVALKLQWDLKSHKQGKTDYPGFCKDAADAGVEKWVVDMEGMTCSYFDRSGQIMVVEKIPG